jgi:hypothetical protein
MQVSGEDITKLEQVYKTNFILFLNVCSYFIEKRKKENEKNNIKQY